MRRPALIAASLCLLLVGASFALSGAKGRTIGVTETDGLRSTSRHFLGLSRTDLKNDPTLRVSDDLKLECRRLDIALPKGFSVTTEPYRQVFPDHDEYQVTGEYRGTMASFPDALAKALTHPRRTPGPATLDVSGLARDGRTEVSLYAFGTGATHCATLSLRIPVRH